MEALTNKASVIRRRSVTNVSCTNAKNACQWKNAGGVTNTFATNVNHG